MIDIYTEVLSRVKDGMSITFTKDNIDSTDHFLIFGRGYDSCTATFHMRSVPFWVEFDNDAPIRLEDCPTTFFKSILKNLD